MAATYEQCAVLFLDVLGFKRLINERREDLIEDALTITSRQYQSNYKVSAFSDNMVVSIAFRHGHELAELIQFASSLTLHLLHVGILSRGGIAVGELRHQGSIVYGPALVEAHRLESQVANYPRIVLAHDAVAKSLVEGGNPQGCEEFIRGFLRTDSDGLEHVNIMDHKALMPFHIMLPVEAQGPGVICFKALIAAKVKAVRHALANNPAIDHRSISKHEWLKNYADSYEVFYTQA
ncbi:hypothetical protein [Pseudomonas sp. G(2018)]|uniref:hypothetical protein n=1 Tax=Pseudomonas sp. G(2018) TaxID=2502242 RepID=UPI0010F4C662|nr:hypothetical protein [Pseudomonas sp. G(2018)]